MLASHDRIQATLELDALAARLGQSFEDSYSLATRADFDADCLGQV
jgi:hypothetical protein